MSHSADLPRDRVVLRTLGAGGRDRYYAFVPSRLRPAAPVIVAVHGISRDAREQAQHFAAAAKQLGCALLAPLMTTENAPGYQRLGWKPQGAQRADHLLDGLLANLAAQSAVDTQRLLLWGFSGGAQFAHRYALHRPERIAALAIGAAGWYTWPTPSRRFPYGLGTRRLGEGHDLQLSRFLEIPTLVLVGSRDVARDAATRTGRRLDAEQGANRLERARRWVESLRAAATERELAPQAELQILAGVAHEFAAFADVGVVERLMNWWTERVALAPFGVATEVPHACLA